MESFVENRMKTFQLDTFRLVVALLLVVEEEREIEIASEREKE